MSKDTLLLSGKPGTGRIAPGKLSPLKPVKAKPELTQQLILKNAEPHTPDIPHWDGDFPFPKNIVYHEERDGKLIADLSMKITPKRWTSPGRTWGEIEAMGGTANAPKFSATVEKAGDFYKLHNAFYQLDIVFRIVDYSSPSWEDGWGKEMERLTGRLGLTLEERKYWAFQHEMDHFTAWSHYFRFMLGHIFQALNAEFASEGLAQTRLKEIQYNSVENFLTATSRSHAFDEIRGAPLRGNKYAEFDFPSLEEYVWHESGDLEPMTYSSLLEEILRVKSRATAV